MGQTLPLVQLAPTRTVFGARAAKVALLVSTALRLARLALTATIATLAMFAKQAAKRPLLMDRTPLKATPAPQVTSVRQAPLARSSALMAPTTLLPRRASA